MSPPNLRRTVTVIPVAFQTLLEGGDPSAGLQFALPHIVERNQIYMARGTSQVLGQQVSLFVTVIDPRLSWHIRREIRRPVFQSSDGSSRTADPRPPPG